MSLVNSFPIETTLPVKQWRERRYIHAHDVLAEECPIALEYNGISHVVMLATPMHLDNLALGFSLSEGILMNRSELFDCDIIACNEGIRVHMHIATERFVLLKEKRRQLAGRSGCGLCGVETLQQVLRHPPRVMSQAQFSTTTLTHAMRAMREQQSLQHTTGATHAAAWLTKQGEVKWVREDVGRHNALDKMIGAMVTHQEDFSSGAALITSRASYEMVQKTATLGIGLLAAISAPTALAVRLALESNVTLLGFVREDTHVVYAHEERLIRTQRQDNH